MYRQLFLSSILFLMYSCVSQTELKLQRKGCPSGYVQDSKCKSLIQNGNWQTIAGTSDYSYIGLGHNDLLPQFNMSYGSGLVADDLAGNLYIGNTDGLLKLEASSNKNKLILGYSNILPNLPANFKTNPNLSIPATYFTSGASNLFRDSNNGAFVISNENYTSSYSLNALHSAGKSHILHIDFVTGDITKILTKGSSATDVTGNNTSLYSLTALSYDPVARELFYLASCTVFDEVTNNAPSIILRKLILNSSLVVQSTETVAGNCTSGVSANNVNALLTPFMPGTNTSIHTLLVVPANVALSRPQIIYFGQNGSTYIHKIINGKTVRLSMSPLAMTYSSSEDKVYVTSRSSSTGVVRFTPTASDTTFDESVSTYIAGVQSSSSVGCNNPGVALAAACADRGFILAPQNSTVLGEMLYAPKLGVNTHAILQLFSIRNNTIEKTWGRNSLIANNVSGENARFSNISKLHFLPNNLSATFSSGLYFSNSLNDIVFGKAVKQANGSWNFEEIAGNRLNQLIINGQNFDLNSSLGTDYAGYSLSAFDFSPSGELFFYTSGNAVYKVSSSGIISNFITGSTSFSTAPDNTASTSLSLSNYGSFSGFRLDHSGNFYFGNGGSGSYALPQFGMIKASDSTLYRVIGNTTLPAVSATKFHPSTEDITTPGSLQGKSINCGYGKRGAYGCWLGEYNQTSDKLFFAESTKIRSIFSPHLATNSKLETLVDMGRPVAAFQIMQDKIYYISEDGKLYCYSDKESEKLKGCINVAVGPENPNEVLTTTALTKDQEGNLYMTSYDSRKLIGVKIVVFTPK